MADRDEQPVPREDRELALRLETALHEELARQHVDVAELVRGTRRRTRRERWRRGAVLAAAAVAVAAVPLGYGMMQQDDAPVTPAGSAASPPSGPATGDTPTPAATEPGSTDTGGAETGPADTTPATEQPSPTPVPVPSPVQRYGIPDEVAPTEDEVGSGVKLILDEEYTNGPTLAGQACGNLTPERRPAARRIWSFSGDADGTFQALVTVTGWRDSRAAFSTLVADAGACRLSPGMDWEERASGVDTWSAIEVSNGLLHGFAARRLEGDVIVTVTVVAPDEAEALREARRILDVTVEHAVDAGAASLAS